MTLKEIMKKHLEDNGFDGLVLEDEGCGCLCAENFMCCDSPEIDCEPGYKVDCLPEFDPTGYEFEWYVTTEKPDKKTVKSVSETCRETRFQACGHCDDTSCGDNTRESNIEPYDVQRDMEQEGNL